MLTHVGCSQGGVDWESRNDSIVVQQLQEADIKHVTQSIMKTDISNDRICHEIYKQARKLQATLEGCNPKLSLTDSLTDVGKV